MNVLAAFALRDSKDNFTPTLSRLIFSANIPGLGSLPTNETQHTQG